MKISSQWKKNHIAKIEAVYQAQKIKNGTKIQKYHLSIVKKQGKYEAKYQEKIRFWNNWISKKQNQETTYYSKYLAQTAAKKLQITNKNHSNLNKKNNKNYYDFKKNTALQQHKKQQEYFKKKYQQQISKWEKWYQDQVEDLLWDDNNFKENLAKNLEDTKNIKLKKLNHKLDKEIYQVNYHLEATNLKAQIKNVNDWRLKKQLLLEYQKLPFKIYHDIQNSYMPLKVSFNNRVSEEKLKIKVKISNFKAFIHNLRYLTFKEILTNILTFSVFTIPLYLYLIMAAIVGFAVYNDTLPKDTMGSMAVLFIIAIVGGEIFNRLPIWKTYIGGGTMGVFFVAAILGTFHVFPSSVVSDINQWFSVGGFLNLYINILIVGSILTIPRKLILKSFSGFMLILVIGSLIAVGFAWVFGTLVGIAPDKNFLQIILPLLSAGNGGGVQPLSHMAEQAGYMSYQQYVSFALAVSSLSNVFVIIIAALLVSFFGNTSLSGHGKIVKKEIRLPKEVVNPTHRNICAGLVFAIIIYLISHTAQILINRYAKIQIDAFVWVVLIALAINLLNILPKGLKDGTNVLSTFFTKQFTLFIMAGVGLCMTDLNTFTSLFTNWKYVLDILLMDIGLILGPLMFANLIKFYSLETMIAAGCCMGAQGGAGSLAVLGAAKRMELLPYSQITSRIGGGIILIIASPLFTYFVNAGYVGH